MSAICYKVSKILVFIYSTIIERRGKEKDAQSNSRLDQILPEHWLARFSPHCVCSRAGSRVVPAPLGFHQLLLFPTIPRFKLVMWDKLVKDKINQEDLSRKQIKQGT